MIDRSADFATQPADSGHPNGRRGANDLHALQTDAPQCENRGIQHVGGFSQCLKTQRHAIGLFRNGIEDRAEQQIIHALRFSRHGSPYRVNRLANHEVSFSPCSPAHVQALWSGLLRGEVDTISARRQSQFSVAVNQKDLPTSASQTDALFDPFPLFSDREIFLSPLDKVGATPEEECQVVIDRDVWVELPVRDSVQQRRSQIMLCQNSAESGQLPRPPAVDLRFRGPKQLLEKSR